MDKQLAGEFANDPDNVELLEMINMLAGCGLTQNDVAKLLAISPSQLTRIKKGERHASWKHVLALRSEVRQLTRERAKHEDKRSLKPPTVSAFSIDQPLLQLLSPTSAVEAFRELLWAIAAEQGVPTTAVSISSRVSTADGGVDASILEGTKLKPKMNDLLGIGTRFQIKTGEFHPWQRAKIKKELFGNQPEGFANLGPAVQRALRDGKRFVLVCFGVDPVDENLRKARENLQSAFKACGYPDTEVEVWGQTQLIGLFLRFPSLCLKLRGHNHQGFRSHSSWASDADMAPKVHYAAETQLLIDELRDALRRGTHTHIRLIGEPGVGKTRLALELTRVDDLCPVTLHVRDARALQQSSFLNELIQTDDRRFVILVIDECPPRDRAEIWNILKPRSERIRLITIDHGPDSASDDKTRVVPVEATGTPHIISILTDYGIDANDARRWAEACEGCPRVAHVIGQNLRQNAADVLQTPATLEVWDRFIVGHDDPSSEEVRLRKTVLRHVALFDRFGFEPPVDAEAKYIAELARQCDPDLTWPRFQSVINTLKERRIIQGATTLYVTPRALHVHLFREYWQTHGSGSDISAMLKAMPQQLWQWFVQMSRFGHGLQPAERAIDILLGHHGLFPSDDFPNDSAHGHLVNSLAEAHPQSVLRCLTRTLGSMDTERLRNLNGPRQCLVWALEKIAVSENLFARSAELLLCLAEAENSTNGNNSTGTFTNLFSLIPGMSPTQAKPSTRLAVLAAALESPSPKKRHLGLAGCETALSQMSGGRIVGSEYQGFRPTIKFWWPETYQELWDAHRDVWELLTAKLGDWTGEDRTRLISTLIRASWTMLQIKQLALSTVDTLKLIANDPSLNTKELVELLKRKLRFAADELGSDVRRELESLCKGLDGYDFPSRLRRFVRHATQYDQFDGNERETSLLDRKLQELASEINCDPRLVDPELPWLVCEDSSPAFCLAYHLGAHDTSRALLEHILEQYATQEETAASSFLGGYLRAIFIRDIDEWETVMLTLVEKSGVAHQFSDLVIASGISDRIARKVVQHCRSASQTTARLERWWFSGQLKQLSVDVIADLMTLQMEDGSSPNWSNAVQMAHTFFMEKDEARSLPETLVFQLLTHDALASRPNGNSVSYYWSRLAAAFLKQYPKRATDFFRAVLSVASRAWSVLLDLNTNEEQLFTKWLREDPEVAWNCIAEVFSESGDSHNFAMRSWLSEGGHRLPGNDSPGPIQHVPTTILFKWVEQDVDRHGSWLSQVLPKTLDKSVAGRLTRDFLARYGKNDRVSACLTSRFRSRGWSGNESDCCRRLREEAHEWLVDERDSIVRRWVENHIDGLNYDIERAEIEEERRRY